MPRVKYPRETVSTGYGTYQELEPGYFEIRWRDGTGERRIRRHYTVDEIKKFLHEESKKRDMIRDGIPVGMNWSEALKMYDQRLRAKGETDNHIGRAIKWLKQIRDESDVEPANVQIFHLDQWIQGVANKAQQPTKSRPHGFPGWARTCNNKSRTVEGFFNWFHQRVLQDGRWFTIEKYDEIKKPPRNLQPAEYGAVWDASETEFRDLLDFLLLTACRFGEAARMKHTDMSTEGVWTVTKRKRGKVLIQDFPGFLMELVFRQAKKPDGLVFHRWNAPKRSAKSMVKFQAGDPIDVYWFDDCLAHRCKLAGVPRFTAHALRHAAGSWLGEQRTDLKTIQSLLGHTQIATTQIYVHGNMKPAVQAAQQTLIKIRSQACAGAANERQSRSEGTSDQTVSSMQ